MILLDTHVIIWMTLDERRIGREARQVIDVGWATGNVAASTLSFWETGMRVQKGRIDLRLDLDLWRRDLLEQGLVEVPVDGGIAVRAGLLRDIHGDPADRIIIATALEGHTLVTADQRMLDWPSNLNRLDARE